MKRILTILLMSAICSNCSAQFSGNAIISNSNLLKLNWDKVEPDYAGETIIYRVLVEYYQVSIDSFSVTADTFMVVDIKSFPDGYYRWGVRAIDDADNKSVVRWSNDELNKYGTWITRRDTHSPNISGGIRGIFQ